MKFSHIKDIAIVLALVAAVWYVRKKWMETQALLDESVAAPIADAITSATLPGDVEVLGKIRMPGGAMISMGEIYVDDMLKFVYNGRKYKLTGRSGDVYTAAVA